MTSLFEIKYRTGGKLNGQWRRVIDAYPTAEEASAKAAEIERMGYPVAVIRISPREQARFIDRLQEAATDMVS